MGNARARKVPAQLVEDEDYQLRHERVAGIDIAKAKADVCTRLPPRREGGRRASRVEDNVPATAREILALAGTPARTYHFQSFTIMVWNTNLLTLLGPVPSHLPGVIGHP